MKFKRKCPGDETVRSKSDIRFLQLPKTGRIDGSDLCRFWVSERLEMRFSPKLKEWLTVLSSKRWSSILGSSNIDRPKRCRFWASKEVLKCVRFSLKLRDYLTPMLLNVANRRSNFLGRRSPESIAESFCTFSKNSCSLFSRLVSHEGRSTLSQRIFSIYLSICISVYT